MTTVTFEDFVGNLSDGQEEAFLRKVWKAAGENPETMRAILRGEYLIRLEDVTVKLVDQNGRVIPLKGLTGVVDANIKFHYTQPALDLSAIYHRANKYFPAGTEFVTEAEYKQAAAALLAEVADDRRVANLLKGCHIPLPLPKIRQGDYGTVLEQDFLSVVARAYEDAYPNRKFVNWRKNDLAEKVTVVDERHEQLVQSMAEGPTVGVYFTNPFQGFDIEADRRMIRELPQGYSLSGGFDAAAAFVADVKTMARDFNTPNTDCAALSWRAADDSLYFNPGGGTLNFDHRSLGARERCSAGLFFSR